MYGFIPQLVELAEVTGLTCDQAFFFRPILALLYFRFPKKERLIAGYHGFESH